MLDIEAAIDRYYSLGVNDTEREALVDIHNTIIAYRSALLTVQRLAEKGLTPLEIDEVVRIDDAPGLHGFDTLTREIAAQSDADAERVEAALALVSDIGLVLVASTVGFTLLLGTLSLWMIRFMIVRPIAKITALMTRLAEGDLDVPIHGSEQKNEIGEMARALEIFKDTALEAIRFEAERRENEMRYRLILDNAVDAIITIDEKGIIESCNPEAVTLFGYQPDEIIGQNIKILMPPPIGRSMTGTCKPI